MALSQGSLFPSALKKQMFYAYVAPGIVAVPGTAMTGIILWNGNPAVNLVLQRIRLAIVASSATTTGLLLAAGPAANQPLAPTSTLPATQVGTTLISTALPSAGVYSQATVVTTPNVIMPLVHNTAAIGTAGVDGTFVDFNGDIIIPPFTYVCLAALGASTAAASVAATLLWQEVSSQT